MSDRSKKGKLISWSITMTTGNGLGLETQIVAEIWYPKEDKHFFQVNSEGLHPHPELFGKRHELDIPAGTQGYAILDYAFKKMNLETPAGMRSMSIGDIVVVRMQEGKIDEVLTRSGLNPVGSSIRIPYLCDDVGWRFLDWDQSLI